MPEGARRATNEFRAGPYRQAETVALRMRDGAPLRRARREIYRSNSP